MMKARGTKVWALLASRFGPGLALLLVFCFFAVADAIQPNGGTFLTARNLQAMLISSAPVVMAALGATVVIIAGGIDLSAGTAMSLCATVLAWVLLKGGSIELALVCCLLTGCLAGAANGIMISALDVAPFIVTLGTMTAYLGFAKLVADETTVRPPLESVPQWLNGLAMPSPKPAWLLVAPGVWIMLLMALVLSAVLRYTVFGRHVFALGSNEKTARLCGLNVPALKVAIYTVAGLFIGVAGVYEFAKLKVGNPISGIGLELKAIAAVVIGGASLNGGRGTVLGTLAGALLMQTILSGCTQLGLSNPIQDIILGIMIIAAVTVDQIRQRRMA
ncbi:MAG TPA: ABC transporter permease [Lacipirellulaceae bacterium]|nr:ABC transporter permease [Lacipirellulaceae bacterium]